jgi:hypothetical protein
MSSAPIVDRIRIIPRPEDFLDRNVGSSGEVFFNRESSSLRVYSGKDTAGFEIARADLENVADADLEARITALGITGGASGGASVDVSATAPTEPEAGNLWLNTTNGRLYIYVNDGDTSQWMQPAVPVFSGSYNDLSDKPALATVATSGSYNDLTDKPTFGDSGFDGSYTSLTGTPTNVSAFTNDAGYITADNITINAPSSISFSTQDAEYATLGIAAGNITTLETQQSGADIALKVRLGNDFKNAVYIDASEDMVGIYKNDPAYTLDIAGDLGATGATIFGLTTLQQTTEVLSTLTGATGVVAHDLDNGAVFYHSSLAADFTANFTNVPETNNRTISVVLLLEQGGTAYIPTAVQIDSQAQTINWQGASTPTGNANQIDVVSFTLIRTGDAWTVIGSLTTYG